MAEREDSSDRGMLLLGPGARPALLLPLLRALVPTPGPQVRQVGDLGELLSETAAGGYLLLDADAVPIEDLGLVRRFLPAGSEDRWLLLLTGDDPSSPVARRLLARAAAATWLPWPIDVEELQALAAGAGSSPVPATAASSEDLDPDRSVAVQTSVPAAPGEPREVPRTRGDEARVPRRMRDDLESRLGRELSAIEAILREEEGLLPGPGETPEHEESRPRGSAGTDPDPMSGLELSREELEAFLGPLESDVPSGHAEEEADLDIESAEAGWFVDSPVEESGSSRGARSPEVHELSTVTDPDADARAPEAGPSDAQTTDAAPAESEHRSSLNRSSLSRSSGARGRAPRGRAPRGSRRSRWSARTRPLRAGIAPRSPTSPTSPRGSGSRSTRCARRTRRRGTTRPRPATRPPNASAPTSSG